MAVKIDNEMNPEIRYIINRKCTPTWEMFLNSLDGINITYIVHGEARYTVDGKKINVSPGNLLVLPRGTLRRAITFPDKLMECFSVDFVLKNSRGHDLSLPFPPLSKPGRHEDIIRLFQELTFTWLDKQPSYIIKCKGLLLQIIHRFLELVVHQTDSYVGDSRIFKVVRHIKVHYSDHLKVKGMAEMVGLNPAYFGVLFHQIMGMSFNNYLTQIRIKNAENMLITGEYKVGEVASACGFTDVTHFYRHFKSIMGYAPSHSLPKMV